MQNAEVSLTVTVSPINNLEASLTLVQIGEILRNRSLGASRHNENIDKVQVRLCTYGSREEDETEVDKVGFVPCDS
jgi:hypothetical protein